MCYFITLGVPKNSQNLLHEQFGRGFALYPSTNASIRRVLPAAFEMWLLTSGMCCCDLYVKPGDQLPELRVDELKAKFRKLGWSPAKVERAAQQAAAKPRFGGPAFTGLRDDIAEKLVAVTRETGSTALVVHWYNGDVETEKFMVSTGGRYQATSFSASAAQLPPDTLIWVDREPGRTPFSK